MTTNPPTDSIFLLASRLGTSANSITNHLQALGLKLVDVSIPGKELEMLPPHQIVHHYVACGRDTPVRELRLLLDRIEVGFLEKPVTLHFKADLGDPGTTEEPF